MVVGENGTGGTFDRFADAEPMAVGDDDVLQRESSSYASARRRRMAQVTPEWHLLPSLWPYGIRLTA